MLPRATAGRSGKGDGPGKGVTQRPKLPRRWRVRCGGIAYRRSLSKAQWPPTQIQENVIKIGVCRQRCSRLAGGRLECAVESPTRRIRATGGVAQRGGGSHSAPAPRRPAWSGRQAQQADRWRACKPQPSGSGARPSPAKRFPRTACGGAARKRPRRLRRRSIALAQTLRELAQMKTQYTE